LDEVRISGPSSEVAISSNFSSGFSVAKLEKEFDYQNKKAIIGNANHLVENYVQKIGKKDFSDNLKCPNFIPEH